MGAVSVRLRWLLRRHWVATLGFALAAGLASGLSLAAWDAARRTDQVFDRFLAATDSPELDVTFCPPEVDHHRGRRRGRLPPVRPAGRARRRPPPAGGGRRSPCRGAHRGDGPRRRPDPAAEQVVFLSAMLDPGDADAPWATHRGRWAPGRGRRAGRGDGQRGLPPPVRRRPGRPPPPAGVRGRRGRADAGRSTAQPGGRGADRRRRPHAPGPQRGQRRRAGRGLGDHLHPPGGRPADGARCRVLLGHPRPGPRWRRHAGRAPRSTGRSRIGRSTTSTASARTTRCRCATPTTTRPRPRWRSPC